MRQGGLKNRQAVYHRCGTTDTAWQFQIWRAPHPTHSVPSSSPLYQGGKIAVLATRCGASEPRASGMGVNGSGGLDRGIALHLQRRQPGAYTFQLGRKGAIKGREGQAANGGSHHQVLMAVPIQIQAAKRSGSPFERLKAKRSGAALRSGPQRNTTSVPRRRPTAGGCLRPPASAPRCSPPAGEMGRPPGKTPR